MSGQSKTGIVQLFERVVEDGAPLVEVQVDAGGGELLTLEQVDPCGDDSPPLPGDYVAISESTGSGAARTAGFADPKNPGKALGGEKRLYARDAGGTPVAELWLKGNGDIAITSIKGGSKITLNGVEIDQQGNITTPGDVTAKLGAAPVRLSTHQHPTGVGPSGPPTPGT